MADLDIPHRQHSQIRLLGTVTRSQTPLYPHPPNFSLWHPARWFFQPGIFESQPGCWNEGLELLAVTSRGQNQHLYIPAPWCEFNSNGGNGSISFG